MTRKKKIDGWLLAVILFCIILFAVLFAGLYCAYTNYQNTPDQQWIQTNDGSFYPYINYQNNQDRDYLLITGVVACATLCFLILSNFAVIRMQFDVKKIQEQEKNLKLMPFLRDQYKMVYSPIVNLLEEIVIDSKHICKEGYYKCPKISKHQKNLQEILQVENNINLKDFNRIKLINKIFENVYMKNNDEYKNMQAIAYGKNIDNVNELNFDIIVDFIQVSKDNFDELD